MKGTFTQPKLLYFLFFSSEAAIIFSLKTLGLDSLLIAVLVISHMIAFFIMILNYEFKVTLEDRNNVVIKKNKKEDTVIDIFNIKHPNPLPAEVDSDMPINISFEPKKPT
jgi:hypothetical protein